MSRIYVAADWKNMEGRLTAHFSGDATLTRELEEELHGGPKVHALNAALIYGIAPGDAATTKVNLKGQQRDAYDAGKRLTHAFNYGMGEAHMAKTFWVARDFAREVIGKLSAKYTGVVAWRERLGNEVYGVNEYRCPGCGATYEEFGVCSRCSSRKRVVRLRFSRVLEEAARVLYTPFHRRRFYLGRRKDGTNALTAQSPQSCGASMWNRTFLLLHGIDFYDWDTRVEIPAWAFHWHPLYNTLADLWKMDEATGFISTGTYDSFLLECEEEHGDEAEAWLRAAMEREWPELQGKRFPVDVARGRNWKEAKA